MSSETLVAGREGTEPIAGFVDVGEFAAHTVVPPTQTRGHEPWLSRCRQLELPPGPISVSVARLDPGAGRELVLSGDEFVLVRDGEIAIRQGGTELSLPAGECAVIPRSVPFEWSSGSGALLIIVHCNGGGGAGSAQPVRIVKNAERTASNPPMEELLIGPTPSCRNHSDYRSQSGEFVCGTWDSTPYHRRPMIFRHYELMFLQKGAVTVVDGLGRTGTFRSGDVVLLKRGGACSWESRVNVEKVYATWRPV